MGTSGPSRRDATAPLAAGVDGEVLGQTTGRTSRPIAALFGRRPQATRSEQIFDVAITEGETNIEPNRVSDDRRGELVARKRDGHALSYRRLETHYRCRDRALVGCTWRRAIRESKAQRLWPRPIPKLPAFRRSALSVRFIFLAISGRGVGAFECALSSRTSSLVHGVRWAEVLFFGTDCCSGKGSRPRATPVAPTTPASKRRPRLGFSKGRHKFPANAPS